MYHTDTRVYAGTRIYADAKVCAEAEVYTEKGVCMNAEAYDSAENRIDAGFNIELAVAVTYITINKF